MTNLLAQKLAFDLFQPVPTKPLSANYLWAALVTRIYGVCLLLRPMCGGHMRQLLTWEPLQNVPPDWNGNEGPFKKIE